MLEEMDLRVCATADTAQRAVELADAHRPILVLMDVRLRGAESGLDAAREIRDRYGTPIIFVTGSCEQEIMDRIQQMHAVGLLIKPILPEQLQAAISRALG